jgi:hypothetical protein
VSPAANVAKQAGQRGLRDDAHPDFVGDQNRTKGFPIERLGQSLYLSEDQVLGVAAKEQVGKPEGQAIKNKDIHVSERAHGFHDLERHFERPELRSPFLGVTPDASRHLLVPRLRGRKIETALPQSAGQTESERALSTSDAAPD